MHCVSVLNESHVCTVLPGGFKKKGGDVVCRDQQYRREGFPLIQARSYVSIFDARDLKRTLEILQKDLPYLPGFVK